MWAVSGIHLFLEESGRGQCGRRCHSVKQAFTAKDNGRKPGRKSLDIKRKTVRKTSFNLLLMFIVFFYFIIILCKGALVRHLKSSVGERGCMVRSERERESQSVSAESW